jgi:fluoroacetyl-CoA thioesterase
MMPSVPAVCLLGCTPLRHASERYGRAMSAAPSLGDSATLAFTVTQADTAIALGSGDVPVLATPRVLAWLEAATVAALAPSLTSDATSVGTRVEVEHVAATPVGAQVVVTAAVSYVDGRLVRFEVAAEPVGADGSRTVAATGRITRVVVDRQRFLDRL